MNRNLGRQWPHIDQFDFPPGPQVPVSQYGVSSLPHEEEQAIKERHEFHVAGQLDVTTVPLEQVCVVDPVVTKEHVDRLAAMPAHLFKGEDAPTATGLPDGRYLVEDGHHRVAAAHQRGDEEIELQLSGRYRKR